MKGYIYHIKNVVNNKLYIGKAVNVDRRIKRHFYDLEHKCHHSIKLQRAYDKYGKDSFIVEVNKVEVKDEDELYEFEIQEINKFNSYEEGYNCNYGGEGNSSKFDYATKILIYNIGQEYDGVIHRLADYFDCDRTTIKSIFTNSILAKEPLDKESYENLIKELELTSDNLKENYVDNFSRRMTSDQALAILALYFTGRYSYANLADSFNYSKTGTRGIISGKTYRQEFDYFNSLSKKEKEVLASKYEKEYSNLLKSRSTTKAKPLNQEQVDYILDNQNTMSRTEIAKQLNIDPNRVGNVILHKNYTNLISNYYSRHKQ